jgi:opacity protein-like surface antigen
MKKTMRLVSGALALSTTLLTAGGDITAVEPIVEVPEVMAAEALGNNFYVGGGYTMPFASELSVTGSNDFETGDSTGMLLIGSDFNKYFGIEARWTPMSGTNDNYALYAKPTWRINENWNLYALIGVGKTERQDVEFQAGAGLGYDIDEHWGLFADFAATDFETELTNLNGDTDTGFSGNASFGFRYTF